MNKEEIEELKEFTIDLTDIDELALGLEICSKKSNMVIQEFIDTIVQLQQENQSLKKENKILRENAEHNDKVVDKVNWENQKLKKELEEYREQVNKGLYNTCLPYTTGYNKAIKDKENQQKEFIEYLENEKDRLARECSRIYVDSLGKTRLVNEDIFNEVDKILSKYKEIIEK